MGVKTDMLKPVRDIFYMLSVAGRKRQRKYSCFLTGSRKFHKMLMILFCAGFLYIPALLSAGVDNILFSDDFSGGLEEWLGVQSSHLQAGRIVLVSPSGKTSERVRVKSGFDWTDIDIEFDVTIQRAQAAWTIREQNGRYYMFILRGPVLSRFIQADKTLHAGDVEINPQVRIDETVHVRIEVHGSVIRHYFNGKLVDSWTDDQLSAGTFGFRQCAGDSASFDNVIVRKAALPEQASMSLPVALASIPFTETVPVIDGRIDEAEWVAAAQLGGFSDLTGFLAERDTKVFSMWDEKNLYLAFESSKRFLRNIPQLPLDGREMFRDDSIEINLMPEEGAPWYKLAFNPAGSQWDARFEGRDGDVDWNGAWQVKNHLIHDDLYVADVWQAEVSVPWTELGVGPPASGSLWRMQFCRNYDNTSEITYPVSERWTSWSPATEGGFNHPDTFGEARFVRDAPAFRFMGYSPLEDGQGGIKGALLKQGSNPVLNLSALRAERDRTFLMREQIKLEETTSEISRSISVESITDVVFQWEVVDRLPVARGKARVTIKPAFAVRYKPVFLLGKVWMEGNLSALADFPPSGIVTGKIEDADGRIMSKAEHRLDGKRNFRFAVSLEKLSAGNYYVKAELHDEKGRKIAGSTADLEVPARPAWADVKTGAIESAPLPWLPVQLIKNRGDVHVKTFAKEYTFAGGVMPDAVNLRGEQFLAAPARLLVDFGSGPHPLRPGIPSVSEVSDVGATLDWKGKEGGLTFDGRARIEFDGLAWYEISLRPEDGRKIREVWLELPLRRKGLRYMRGRNSMNFMRGKWAAALIGDAKLERDYPAPEELRTEFSSRGWRWNDFFSNFTWIGGVDRGLFVMLPSPRLLPEEGPFNFVDEQDDVILLRILLAGGKPAGQDNLNLSFGLMGTPTRPLLPVHRDRMNRTGFNNIPKLDPESLDLYLGRMDGRLRDKYFTGPDLIVTKGDLYAKTVQAGIRASLGYPDLDDAQRQILRREREIASNVGMKTILWCDLTYTAITYGEAPSFEAEWEQYPPQRQLYSGEYHTLVCPSGSWKDFYLYHIDKLMKEEKINGVYLDMTGPGSCNNPYHGCGYERDGERHGEIPILALRDLFLRLYNTVQTNDPDGVVFYHSPVFTPFSMYAHLGTRGENWAGAEDYRTFSLPYYQAAYMVHLQYGVPFDLFATHNYPDYRAKPEDMCTQSEVVGLSLLHDTLPVSHNSQQIPGLVTLYNTLRDFGAYDESTVWTPYWENTLGDWQDGIAVSTYRNVRGETLLVAFNPGFEEKRDIILNIVELGAQESYNVITGETDKAAVQKFSISPRDIRILWLR
ncbi:MAG: hypothetical protein JW957_04450 [Candidatus Omnitrophica bacterium]|nr:hypothetical protein [Candidatus Omnitrophota bacterium]